MWLILGMPTWKEDVKRLMVHSVAAGKRLCGVSM